MFLHIFQSTESSNLFERTLEMLIIPGAVVDSSFGIPECVMDVEVSVALSQVLIVSRGGFK